MSREDRRPADFVRAPLLRSHTFEMALLTVACAAVLLWFIGKPFDVDDPLFVWAGEQITRHPLDPYGFDVNWYGSAAPMSYIAKNPPLACYLIAGVIRVFGTSEYAIHAAFDVVAIAAILGTYQLARLLCERPLLAAALTLLTPAFLVSANTVMCDVLMLALWVWALFMWISGLRHIIHSRLWLSAFLISLAMLTKYFAASLLPLLVLYTSIRRPVRASYFLPLLIPIATLITYHTTASRFMGRSVLEDAIDYNGMTGQEGQILSAVSFIGACSAGIFAWLAMENRKVVGLSLLIATPVIAIALISFEPIARSFVHRGESIDWPFLIQWTFWLFAGGVLLAMACLWLRRDTSPETILLVLWGGRHRRVCDVLQLDRQWSHRPSDGAGARHSRRARAAAAGACALTSLAYRGDTCACRDSRSRLRCRR